jgi:exoribonuclease-2
VAAKLVAPFKPKDADLFAVVQGFDDTYTAYADHQRRMEYFWCLRWITQEAKKEVVASVVKGDLLRLEEVPLMIHVPGLGVHARGTRVLLEVMSVDELTVETSMRPIRVVDAPGLSVGASAEEEEEADELVEAVEDDSAQSEGVAQDEAEDAARDGGDAAEPAVRADDAEGDAVRASDAKGEEVDHGEAAREVHEADDSHRPDADGRADTAPRDAAGRSTSPME